MGYKRSDFRTELNIIFDDASNGKWTADQKNSAINQAVDALWPYFRSADVDETVTLAAGTFEHFPTAIPPETGFQLAYLQQGTSEPYRAVRGGVITQRRLVDSGTLKWKIYVPEKIVSSNAGKKLRLHYYKKFPLYSGDDTSQEVPWNPVLYFACYILCLLQQQRASSTKIWQEQEQKFLALWERFRNDAPELTMPQVISILEGP